MLALLITAFANDVIDSLSTRLLGQVGSGFAGTLLTGRQHNDEFYVDENGERTAVATSVAELLDVASRCLFA